MSWKSLYCILFLFLFLIISCAEREIGALSELTPVPIAPEDGSTITQNPPTFIWQSLAVNGIVYFLDVSTDTHFTTSSIVIATLIEPPDTNYIPDDPLAPGEYYWHVTAKETC